MKDDLRKFWESLKQHPGVPWALFFSTVPCVAVTTYSPLNRISLETTLVVLGSSLSFWALVFYTAWAGRNPENDISETDTEKE